MPKMGSVDLTVKVNFDVSEALEKLDKLREGLEKLGKVGGEGDVDS